MFDVGFWEIALISLIALLILGPERLPRAARSLGMWVGKARRMLAEVKRDIDRELDAADLKEVQDIKSEVEQTVNESKNMFEESSIKQGLDEAKSALDDTAEVLNEKVAESAPSTTQANASDKKRKSKPTPADDTSAAGSSESVA